MSEHTTKDLLKDMKRIKHHLTFEVYQSIRVLIEKFFGKNGWQEKADIINDEDYPGIPVNNLRKAYNLILEIRDFGKQPTDEEARKFTERDKADRVAGLKPKLDEEGK